MKSIFKLPLLFLSISIFLSCEKEVKVNDRNINENTQNEISRTTYVHYGDVISIRSPHTNRYVTGAWAAFNYDAWFVTTSVGSYEKFIIIDPSNPSSTAQLKTGDVVALKNQVTSRYLVRESDGDVNCDRTVIGSWEKWQFFFTGTTSSGTYIPAGSALSLRSDAGPYLNYDGVYDAKATGTYSSNTTCVNNPNCIAIQLYL